MRLVLLLQGGGKRRRLECWGSLWGRVGVVTEYAVTLQKVPGHTASTRGTARLLLHNDTEIYLAHQLGLVSGTSLQ